MSGHAREDPKTVYYFSMEFLIGRSSANAMTNLRLPHHQSTDQGDETRLGRAARPQDDLEVKSNCSFEVPSGDLRAIVGKLSCLVGLPFARPVVVYNGKTGQGAGGD